MKNTEIAMPDAASLIQSLRAFGYDVSTAIADLIDNSITAHAKNINIQFEWNSGNPWIAIFDDGAGMSEAELYEAMKPGSRNPLEKRDKDDLGRFGLGLKTASFSQCKKLTVMSKGKGNEIATRCWDLDFVTEKNEWLLIKDGSDIAKTISGDFFSKSEHGTIILWENIDRLIDEMYCDDEKYQDAFLEYARAVENHIALVFSGYMRGRKAIQFTLNNNLINLWDPFLVDKSTQLPEEILYVGKHEVSVKPYILPHHSKLSAQEFADAGGDRGWNDQQGFYIYRENRLIVSGDWLIPGLQNKEQYKLARIRVDIGNDTDVEWGIDVKKAVAVPPVQIRDEMRRIAIAARKESSRIFRHRGKKLARAGESEKTYVWHQSSRHGKLGYRINRNHPIIKQFGQKYDGEDLSKILDLIEETIPVPMIISDYTEQGENMLKPYEQKEVDKSYAIMESLFDMYKENGLSEEQAINTIASIEPFVYSPEKVAVFCEKKGIGDGII